MTRRVQYTVDAAPPYNSASGSVFVACRIAMKYAHRIPTPQELMAELGMTRATAYRWVRAFKDARGVA